MAEIKSAEKIKASSELAEMKLQCSSPDRDIIVYPRWICFHSENGYKAPLFARFFMENREPYTVIYKIKAREKIFRIDSASGLLKAGERKSIRLFLISSDDWPLGVAEYTQKRIKMAIETLRVHSFNVTTSMEGINVAKSIWKRSYNEWPLERLYTKINIFLVPIPGDRSASSSISTGVLTKSSAK